MVLVKHSHGPFVSGWYDVAVKCLSPSSAHTVAKKLPMNRTPLSVSSYVCKP